MEEPVHEAATEPAPPVKVQILSLLVLLIVMSHVMSQSACLTHRALSTQGRKKRAKRNRKKKKKKTPQDAPQDYGSEEEPSDEASGSEDEDRQDYKKGGYHPVRLGELYNTRYRVLSKLGWGQFSTVWLCKDEADESGRRVTALKIQRSAAKYTEAAMDEIELCRQV